MKYLTLILLICVSSFSLNKIVIPQRASSGSVITASKTNENLDTIASKVNKLIDSLDQKFPRFTDYSSGDSILRSKRADFDTTVSDTMYNSGGLYSERVSTPSAGITAANIDTSHSRHTTADSATIPVFKGTKTFRDSSYFAGGLRGSRLYMQTASVDSFTKSFVVRGNVFGFSQTAGSCPFTSYGTTNKINGYFGTLSNNDGGVICYDSSGTARINLPTRGSGYILGSIAINQTTPDSNLTVGGSAHVTGNARIDGGLRLGSGDLLSVYDTGSFACTTKTSSGFTVQKVSRIKYTVVGNIVTMAFTEPYNGVSNSTMWLLYCGDIPDVIKPSVKTTAAVSMLMDNGVYVSACAEIQPSVNIIAMLNNSSSTAVDWTSSGTKGFVGTTGDVSTSWTYIK